MVGSGLLKQALSSTEDVKFSKDFHVFYITDSRNDINGLIVRTKIF